MYDFELRIKNKYCKLSKKQKLVADYLLKNYENVAFSNVNKLSTIVGVSESTIIRFAIRLGYNGYPDLQIQLRNKIKEKLNTVNKMNHFSSEKDNSVESIINNLAQNDIINIKKTFENVSINDFKNFVKKIIRADKILVVGLKTSAPLAYLFGYMLNFIVENVYTNSSFVSNNIFEHLIKLGKDDLVIAISFPRYTRQTVEVIDYAKRSGIMTAAITDKITSPLAQLSDVSLYAETELNTFIESFAAPVSIINALLITISLLKKAETRKYLTRAEQIWMEYEVFY